MTKKRIASLIVKVQIVLMLLAVLGGLVSLRLGIYYVYKDLTVGLYSGASFASVWDYSVLARPPSAGLHIERAPFEPSHLLPRLSRHSIRIPLWALIVIGLMCTYWFQKLAASQGQCCSKCGYSLVGLEGATKVCPECGTYYLS